MISKEVFSGLKQTNISKDSEKTKVRVKAVWQSLSKDAKQEIFNISGLKKATVERTCRMGNISAILTVALGQVAGVDPQFLIGESDDRNPIDEETIPNFLIDLGYEKLLNEQSARYSDDFSSPYFGNYGESDSKAPTHASILAIAGRQKASLSEEQAAIIDTMSEEELIYLTKALFLRAKFNDDAAALTNLLKLILIV
ncbi:MAG: hypothetical protein LBU32_03350 [Clostridiales bacterium]|jgi:hypothetical protein|nr:hypothetical protein [Clostridiales bacterium]